MAPETAGYLVLGAADQLVNLPVGIDAQRCTLFVDGGRVTVARDGPAATPLDTERALRSMLNHLLSAASGGSAALQAVASLRPRGSVSGLVAELESALIPVNRHAAARALSRLARETARAKEDVIALTGATSDVIELESGEEEHDTEPIEVPVRRVPPVREVEAAESARASRSKSAPSPVNDAEFAPANVGSSTSEVDELLAAHTETPAAELPPVPDLEPPRDLSGRWGRRGGSSAPSSSLGSSSSASSLASSASASSLASSAGSARGVDELLEGFMAADPRHEDRLSQDLRNVAGVDELLLVGEPERGGAFENAAGLAFNHFTPSPRPTLAGGARSSPKNAAATETPVEAEGPRKRRWPLLLSLLLVLLGGAAVYFWLHDPGFLSGRDRNVLAAEQRISEAFQAVSAARQACRATVLVTDVPAGAEVLIGAGNGPVDVERVPSGAQLEFVAFAEGYAPRRAAIPAGAPWDMASGKPRFELAIQLERSRAKPAALDPWPAATPGSTVGGPGSPGTVHVVTTPKGAEVWMVAGGAPEARIEALPCGTAVDLLVAGAAGGQPYRRRLHVDSGQSTPSASANTVVARVSAAN